MRNMVQVLLHDGWMLESYALATSMIISGRAYWLVIIRMIMVMTLMIMLVILMLVTVVIIIIMIIDINILIADC